mgnify:CR=1 FL=1
MQTYIGTIRTTGKGLGFVRVEDERFDGDLFIEQGELQTALPGDTVEVIPHPKKKGEENQTAEVVRVVERARTQFVGRVERQDGFAFVIPDNTKIYTDFLVVKEDAKDLVDGQKVLVELFKWTNQEKDPLVKIVEVLGTKGDHEVEIRSILLERGIDTHFPPDVVREAEAIHADWYANTDEHIAKGIAAGRRDFRDTLTITIDPASAKDFDDAISLKKTDDDKYELAVHIADVSYYVRPGTKIDAEAAERGFSTYLVDRTIPMLPHQLSTDICSLNPNVDRFAFSCVFTIDASGKVYSSDFTRSVIHSDRRFTYEDAQDSIDNDGDYAEELRFLNELAKVLRRKRFKKGAVDFDTDEFYFELDDKGYPIAIHKKERLDTHKLVEEFMLLANKAAARFTDDSIPFVYRVHDVPDPEKLEQLKQYLSALKIPFDVDVANVTPKDLKRLFAAIEGTATESLIKTAAIRSMAKAVYSTGNIGHFGLGFQHYTHFTSPIRRYADLIVHRIIGATIAGTTLSKEENALYDKMMASLTEKEITIAQAERESISYKQTEYMQGKIGEVLQGVITGVTKWGLYVQDQETGAEGLLPVRVLADDYYELDEKRYRLLGQRSGKTYTLGDAITVKVATVDVERRQMDFTIPAN